ncbi:MAG: nitroreductase family protein [Tannerella sp.]|jgi:nitroreductase|nr:nitroreductase family protein [Tannerella sp.]
MENEKRFSEIVNFRRSTRHYDNSKALDPEKVKSCIELATLAPNSSNMQLWEFYHVTDTGILQKLARAYHSQMAATTAQEMVVFVTRQDLFRKRARKMMELEIQNVLKNSQPQKHEKRIKRWRQYYGIVMPLLYARFFGVLGFIRKTVGILVGIFRPSMYQLSESDMRVVVHKTCGLAAQTFMLAMAETGYDTCPMEGFDSRMVKKILKLPFGAGINMVISCGIRKEGGIWGDRMRIPFDEVYRRI